MIALLRVDNRLLHGQVLETWIPKLRATRVVVADDQAAQNLLARTAMTLCLPPSVRAEVVPLGGLDWRSLATAKDQVLVLVRDVEALGRAREGGLGPAEAPRVNVGNVHFGAERRSVTPSVWLSGSEIRTLRDMEAAGFAVEVRAIPTEPPTGMAEIERRYAAP
ncbi:MAG: PTS sugar transporter subunit IIB [Anaeromyxobacteraceae bacterium]